MEDPNGSLADSERKPLSYVISDCVQRWFQDTYKQARAGDPAMMVLLAQMFHSGYGVPKNEQKVCPVGGSTSDLFAFLPFFFSEIGDLIAMICFLVDVQRIPVNFLV
ncbi:hypothetical protein PR202_ga04347 [Eleusine coracana subsp. coracana]|uniref:Uncharacterized protein n=1 Tax=Eleusine coracana subsp. coracana TaxID=191504 RepID=A0AAV5BRE8_ELECO|nr:hypothetical protein PR202_ga04347 [Eleusine coracana subsp. coracana]